MLKVAIVDLSAESRQKIASELYSFISQSGQDLSLIPRVDIKQVARQELKFQETPDIVVLGEQLIGEGLHDLQEIRKSLPEAGLIIRLNKHQSNLSFIEQLARHGVDDTYSDQSNGLEVLKKIVLLGRRQKKSKQGKLIVVDSGKGGVGVTSIVAALGDLFLSKGKKVALLDCDFETQDLSRFLNSKPFINENLQLLLDQQRPINQESVQQALSLIFESDNANLSCMSPVADSDALHSNSSQYARQYVAMLEVLDATYDIVIVDCASARGAILKTLYKVADTVLFVLSNDPANLYAAVDRFSRVRSSLSSQASLRAVVNASEHQGLDFNLLKAEFARAVNLDEDFWCPKVIPCCKRARRWPGSGATLNSLGSKAIKQALESVSGCLDSVQVAEVGTIDSFSARAFVRKIWRTFLAAAIVGLNRFNVKNNKDSKPHTFPKELDNYGAELLELPTQVSQQDLSRLLSPPEFQSTNVAVAAIDDCAADRVAEHAAEQALEPELLISGARFS